MSHMGLLTKLFIDSADDEFKLAQDLVGIAIADGEISEAEQKVINEICKSEGMTNDTIADCLMGFDKEADALVPTKKREKMDYLSKLIRVMGADGHSSHMEIYLLEIIASKMGISHMELVSLVLMTATRKYFSGDTGAKTLSSFLHNVIDPKGKNLRDNRDNINKIFDLIAENISQLRNAEEDRNAFTQAISSASELLFENALLDKEFKDLGIDFKRVVAEEREQAIRRWTL